MQKKVKNGDIMASRSKHDIKAADILNGIVLSVLFICLSVTFTLNFRAVYSRDIDVLSIEERTGLGRDALMEDYDRLIRYNNILGPEKLEFKHFRMSTSGRVHFEEVRRIFHGFEYGLIISFILAAVLTLIKKNKMTPAELITAAVTPFIAISLICIAISTMGWNRVFVLFHQIAFNNDLWIFDAETDPVINALPEEFFLHEALTILSCLFFLSVISMAFAIKMMKRKAHRKSH